MKPGEAVLNVSQIFPAATDVEAFVDEMIFDGGTLRPAGAAVGTSTVQTDGTLSYSGLLSDGTGYVAGAKLTEDINGPWTLVHFTPAPTVDSTDAEFAILLQQLEALEKKVDEIEPGGGSGGGPYRPIDFGAKADCKVVLDGFMNSGSAALISNTALFEPSDVGKSIRVQGAGVGTKNEIRTITATGTLEAMQFKVKIRKEVSAIFFTPATTAAAMQASLEALPSVGAGNVKVTLGAGTSWIIEFIGKLSNQPINEVSITEPTFSEAATLLMTRTQTGASVWLETTIAEAIGPEEVILAQAAGSTPGASRVVYGTNDTLAIQAAIDAAHAGGGGLVEAARGESYFISAKGVGALSGLAGFTTWHLRLYSNITFRGNGASLHYKPYVSGAIGQLMCPEGVNEWRIEDWKHHGGQYTETELEHPTILVGPGTKGWRIEGNVSEHFGGKFLFIKGLQANPCEYIRCDRNEVRFHSSNAIGINGSKYWTCNENYCHDCQTYDSAEWFIGNGLYFGSMRGNKVRQYGNTNISYQSACEDCFVMENDIQLMAAGAIAGVSIGGGALYKVENCVVAFNTFDISNLVASTFPNGISLNAGECFNNKVVNNTIILGTPGAAASSIIISAGTARNNLIEANTIELPEGTFGGNINTVGAGHGFNTIANNMCPQSRINPASDDSVIGNRCAGIALESRIYCADNIAVSATSQALRVNGNNNVVRGGSYTSESANANISAVELFNSTTSNNTFKGVKFHRTIAGARHIYIINGAAEFNLFSDCELTGVEPSVTLTASKGSRIRRSRGIPPMGAGCGELKFPAGEVNLVVTHNMGYTPLPGEVIVTPMLPSSSECGYWVYEITATTFKISLSGAGPTEQRFGYCIQ